MTDEGKENIVKEESEDTPVETEKQEEKEPAAESKIEENKTEDNKAEESEPEEKGSEVKSNTEEVLNNPRVPFFLNLGAAVIDQCLVGIVSIGALYLFNLIIKPMGYQVTDRVSVYIIIYIILNVLYPAIIEHTKLGCTVGKMFCGLRTFTI